MTDYTPSGKNSDAKMIMYRPSDYEGEPLLYVLTQRQTSLLLAITAYLRWKNRYAYTPEDLDTQQKITDYIDRLDNALMVEIEFCAFMIACIENDQDTKNALANLIVQLINENQSINQALDNQRQRSDGSYPPYGPNTSGNILDATDCDKDKGAGFIRTGVVDRARSLVTAFLADMELATDKNEAIRAWIDAVPVLGATADEFFVDSIVGAWDNFRDWIQDAWEAEDTDIDRLEETYRDLLCIWEQSDCTISLEQIRDYFIQKAFGANPGFADALGTIVDLVNFLNGISTSFTGIWYVMMGTVFQAGFVANSLFGMDVPTFKLMANLGDPTDDWIAWEAIYGPCECVTVYTTDDMPPDYEIIFGSGPFIFVKVLVSSEESTFGGSIPLTSAFDIDFNIAVTSALRIGFVFSSSNPEGYAAVLHTSTGDINPVVPYDSLIGPDRFELTFELSGFTGTLEGATIKLEDGDTHVFDLKEIRVYEPC